MDHMIAERIDEHEFGNIHQLSHNDFINYENAYKKLLMDVINNGGRLGFHFPLNMQEVNDYLHRLNEQLGRGEVIFIAYMVGRYMLGSAQIVRGMFEDSRHVGEVVKLMVRSEFRKRGVAFRMMKYCDRVARDNDISLLCSTACAEWFPVEFYKKCGYRLAGVIPGALLDSNGSLLDVSKMYKQIGV